MNTIPPIHVLAIAAAATITLVSCDAKRAAHGPWEYAELSCLSTRCETARVGAYAHAVKPTRESEFTVSLETGEKSFTASDFGDLITKLGGKKPAQSCSTAVLNYLDQDGWEVASYSTNLDMEPMVVPDGTIGANLSETHTDLRVWILRRAR